MMKIFNGIIVLILIVFFTSCGEDNYMTSPNVDEYKYGSLFKTHKIKSILGNNGVNCGELLKEKPSYFGYFFYDLTLYCLENKDIKFDINTIHNELLQCFKSSYGQYLDGDLVITLGGVDSWWRSQFARDNAHVLNTYKITGNLNLLRFVESQVDIWLKHIPRKIHKGFNVFPYGMKSIKNKELSYYAGDPNQNFDVALLFSLLYFIPESKFYKNPLFKDISENEIGQGLSLQKGNGGFLLAELVPELETNYTGYATSILYCLAQTWDKPEYFRSIAKAGRWLRDNYSIENPMSGLKGEVYRDNSYNMIGRIPAFYVAGVSSDYVIKWGKALINRYSLDENYLIPFFYSSVTIPISYYTDINIKRKVPPLVFYENNKLRVYADNIDYISFFYKIGKINLSVERKFRLEKELKYVQINGGNNIYLEKYNVSYPVSIEFYDFKNIKEKFN